MNTDLQNKQLLQELMQVAIEEAKVSLREGNSGFGAVIARGGRIIARAHDTDSTDSDPTAHAEIKAIRSASAHSGGDLKECLLVATHEPCPMCSTAAFWAGIGEIAFGYSIGDAIKQGRRRIDISLREVYARGGREVLIHEPVLPDRCTILYNRAVRNEVALLRNADCAALKKLADEKCHKRRQWFRESYAGNAVRTGSILDDAYRLFLTRLGISGEEAPIVMRSAQGIVIHSRNFCPTLEACKILDMDTRFVCRHYTEEPTTELVRQLHPSLRFSRNYEKLRPYEDFCEEMLTIEGD